MIIDANDLFRQTLKNLLLIRFPAVSFERAGAPAEALRKLNAFHADIIFMDIKLPVQNGLTLIKQLKRIYPHAIIIAITNYDLPEYQEAARRQGADYFL